MRDSEAKKAIGFLKQALNCIQGSQFSEVKKSIQQSMAKLENIQKSVSNKKMVTQTNAQNWWGTVVSGVANSPMSKESAIRSLSTLNQMSQQQNNIIDNIEAEVQNKQPTKLLKD